MAQEYSNLEVDRHANAPEVFPYYAPQFYPDPDADTSKVAYASTNNYDYDYEQTRIQTVCGLRRRKFWIIVIASIIVVLAAVGGGIGGALASRFANSNNAAPSSTTPASIAQASTIPESSSTSTPAAAGPSKTISTTAIVGPTATILRDCPSSEDTIHSVTLGGATMYYRKACNKSLVNSNRGWNALQSVTKTLDECIDLCASYNNMNRTRIRSGTDRICDSVCWRNTFDKINDWEGGHCFGYSSNNSSGTFDFKQPMETRCDSAMLINQQEILGR
ncbi:hypothetical protein CC86DRAFT_372758 [Ophiobolus disseminans]|uniref:Apple domain-containing protein n=1 Tax=Ophiobolus disseminans TaxID=1469910 RepID=A0A6A6ZPH7_9PLEO|nr:hypothetical protein CC86DRAFT_372758 [Ophiobolus disseminans]